MEKYATPSARVSAEAAEWFVRLQEPVLPHEVRAAFAQWLLNSPEHIQAFMRATEAWAGLGAVTDESTDSLIRAALADEEPTNVVTLQSAAPAAVSNSERRARGARQWRYAAAASLLFATGLLAWFGAGRWLERTHIRTAIGEQRTLTMADGSLLYVNAESDLSIRFDAAERRVRLIRGEARFEVAKDRARPFIVDTPQARVRAVGTIFNVQAAAARTAVTVLEGRVEVTRGNATGGTASVESSSGAPATRSTQLAAGERAAVTAAGAIIPGAGRSIESALAWSERSLVFRGEALADVVAEFNHYDVHSIRIEDPTLAALNISGTFAANDSESLLQYLQRYHGVRVRTQADGVRVLSRARDEK